MITTNLSLLQILKILMYIKFLLKKSLAKDILTMLQIVSIFKSGLNIHMKNNCSLANTCLNILKDKIIYILEWCLLWIELSIF